MWKTFAERRFDDLVRRFERYGFLGRKDRLDLFQHGEQRELAPGEVHAIEEGSQLFVLSGAVDFEHEGLRVSQRGSTLLEARRPLQVEARENTRLVLLKPEAVRGDGKGGSPRFAA